MPSAIRRTVHGLLASAASVWGGVDTPESYAAGAAASAGERRTSIGWRGGSSWPPAATARNVGQGVSPGRAQRPSRRK